MAIQMALNGGMGILHYNMSDEKQVKEAARVKNHIHGYIQDPITANPEQTIGSVLDLIKKHNYGFSTFPVVKRKHLNRITARKSRQSTLFRKISFRGNVS